MSDEYIHKKGIVFKNQFHVIFCPKYRRKVLVNGIDIRLKELLYQFAEEDEVNIKALEVMPDHVHLFIEFDPRKNVHHVIKLLKGKTSRALRNEFPQLKTKLPSLWTRSYFCCSVGHISEEAVQSYIESQKGK